MIDRFRAELAARGPVPWAPAIGAALAERTATDASKALENAASAPEPYADTVQVSGPPPKAEPATDQPFVDIAALAARKLRDTGPDLSHTRRGLGGPQNPPAPSAKAPLTADSPAVAGILKLRRDLPPVNDEVRTEDTEADAIWARELFLATRKRGYGA